MSMEKTEKEKMLSGEMYNPFSPELEKDRLRVRKYLYLLNNSKPENSEERIALINKILPNAKSSPIIEPPFYCDYGYNIFLGKEVYFNFNCVILDVMPVTVGAQTIFGPQVQLYTATHPLNAIARHNGLEFAKPITIGKQCWIGGGAIINPGVTIGDRVVIGSGSVVTKDIPNDVLAVGNPCRIIQEI